MPDWITYRWDILAARQGLPRVMSSKVSLHIGVCPCSDVRRLHCAPWHGSQCRLSANGWVQQKLSLENRTEWERSLAFWFIQAGAYFLFPKRGTPILDNLDLIFFIYFYLNEWWHFQFLSLLLSRVSFHLSFNFSGGPHLDAWGPPCDHHKS